MARPKESSAQRRADNRARALNRPHRRVRARRRLPGARYKVTRRTLERRFFFAPDAATRNKLNNLIGYLLAYCCELYGIDIHAVIFEANHPHKDLTDKFGNLGEFKAVFNGLLARGINVLRGRHDRVWSGDRGCDTEPITGLVADDGEEFPSSPLADLVYTLTNPVKDGLVKNGGRWPGFTTYGWRFGETRTFKRPDWFFTPGTTTMPETADLTLRRPPGVLPQLSDDELFEQLMREVREREQYFQARMRSENRRFMGEKKLAREHWNSAPRSNAPRFFVTPKVVGATKWERLAGIQRNRKWEADYADAYDRLLGGELEVEFPFGTDQLRKYAGVKVARPPP